MEELTTFLVRSLVREPDAVSVEESERRGEPILLIRVAESDRGTVIGRQGRTIRAIETILDAASHGGHRPGLDVQAE
jgi:hypothetical protein